MTILKTKEEMDRDAANRAARARKVIQNLEETQREREPRFTRDVQDKDHTIVSVHLPNSSSPFYLVENKYGKSSERIYKTYKGAQAAIRRGRIRYDD